MIHGYADESIRGEEVLAAAVAVFAAPRVPEAEAVLAEAKESLGLPADAVLSCKDIFSGHRRQKTAWADITVAAIEDMLRNLCRDMKAIEEHHPIAAVLDPRQVPPQPVAPGLPNRVPHVKALASLAYQAAFDPILRRFGPDGVKIWIDPVIRQSFLGGQVVGRPT